MVRNNKGQFTSDPRPELRGKNNPAKRHDVRKKMSESRKGRVITKSWRDKLAIALSGNKNAAGHKHSEEWKKRNSERMRGNQYNYQGGKTALSSKIRNSSEYKLIRTACFERDNYTCVWCGQIGGQLNADHIKPFSLYPELRFALDNLRTLCLPCHRTTDTYGFKIKKYKVNK